MRDVAMETHALPGYTKWLCRDGLLHRVKEGDEVKGENVWIAINLELNLSPFFDYYRDY